MGTVQASAERVEGAPRVIQRYLAVRLLAAEDSPDGLVGVDLQLLDALAWVAGDEGDGLASLLSLDLVHVLDLPLREEARLRARCFVHIDVRQVELSRLHAGHVGGRIDAIAVLNALKVRYIRVFDGVSLVHRRLDAVPGALARLLQGPTFLLQLRRALGPDGAWVHGDALAVATVLPRVLA